MMIDFSVNYYSTTVFGNYKNPVSKITYYKNDYLDHSVETVNY